MKQWAALLLFVTCCHGYNILGFFPFPGRSHHRVWDPLLKELAERGHQVTAVKGFKMEDPPKKNYKEYYMSNDVVTLFKDDDEDEKFLKPNFFKLTLQNLFYKDFGLQMGKYWVNDPTFKNILSSNETFDAVLYESTFLQEFVVTMQHKFNAVGIEVFTIGNHYWTYWCFGNPTDTSYIVEAHLDYTDRMTFLQRLHLTFHSLAMNLIWSNYYAPQYEAFMNEHMRYPGWESRPSMMEMLSNTSLVLINTDVALSYPHAMSPHFVPVGGLNVVPNKPLPKDLQEFMDGAQNGVIFFSLGSHIEVNKTLGESLVREIADVFSNLKQKVLWKSETDFNNLPANVRLGKWFPQQDILAHKNLILFISHGGFQSMTESVHHGKPMVLIPILGDQDKNANFIASREMGIHLTLSNLTGKSVQWAISEILSHPRYEEKAKQQSMILRDKKMSPLETAVYWTEYVIRHKGAKHLRPAIATMPWYQQAMIDVYAALAAIVLIPIYVLYKLICCVCRCLCRRNKNKTNTKKKKE